MGRACSTKEYNISDREAEGEDQLGYLGAGERILLKSVLKKYDAKLISEFIWIRV